MKTTVILSCIVVGGSLLNVNLSPGNFNSTSSVASYKLTKAKRTTSAPRSPIRIVIDKSDYELSVYDAQGWYATYPVVFGNSSLEDKKMEGDRNTPEGSFKVAGKKLHDKWDRYIALNYPTKESLEKFNERKIRGEIPKNARPGGGIGIHGTWPHEDFVIDRYKNWTNGCISLKRTDVEEIYDYVPVGTPVYIKK
ncbi:MAG: L,D-transpeptidase [Chitinophagaceae bacterium]|nr:L,D-transpeptidase [Chitinophagaceae bacterium]